MADEPSNASPVQTGASTEPTHSSQDTGQSAQRKTSRRPRRRRRRKSSNVEVNRTPAIPVLPDLSSVEDQVSEALEQPSASVLEMEAEQDQQLSDEPSRPSEPHFFEPSPWQSPQPQPETQVEPPLDLQIQPEPELEDKPEDKPESESELEFQSPGFPTEPMIQPSIESESQPELESELQPSELPSQPELDSEFQQPIAEPQSEPQPEQEFQPRPIHDYSAEPVQDSPFEDYQPFGARPEPVPEFESPSESNPELQSENSTVESEVDAEPWPISSPESKSDAEPVSEALSGEVIDVEEVGAGLKPAPTSEEIVSDKPSNHFRDQILQLLRDANLTPRHLKFCCGGFLAFLLILSLAFFLLPRFLGFSFLDRDTTETASPDEDPKEPSPSPEPTLSSVPSGVVWVDPSIYSGLLLGEPSLSFEGNTGIVSGLVSGESTPSVGSGSQFQQMVVDLESLYAVYLLDPNAVLDASANRTEALDRHLDAFRMVYQKGLANEIQLQAVRQDLFTQFDAQSPLKEQSEREFFVQIESFEEVLAQNQLEQFISISQEMADVKAWYLAFGKVEDLYEIVLKNSERRIRDIEFNREALISGVQVVDVFGSDLDLILKETQLEE